MQIRLANVDDVETLVALRAAFLAEVANADGSDAALLESLRQYFTDAIGKGEFVAYLAKADKVVVACSGLVYDHRPPSPGNLIGLDAYIMNRYTRPEWRGRGIATELLRQLLDHVRSSECRRVRLHALASARAIYERAGFMPLQSEMRLEL